jgi:hypothetical protein
MKTKNATSRTKARRARTATVSGLEIEIEGFLTLVGPRGVHFAYFLMLPVFTSICDDKPRQLHRIQHFP